MVYENEDLRKNLTIIVQALEKQIDNITPQTLLDFSNFLNVARLNDFDRLVSGKVKQGIIRRAQVLSKDEAHKEDFAALSFDQLSKILSDLVHYGYVTQISTRLYQNIQNTNQLSNIQSIVRLFDSFFASEQGIESNDFLISRIEKLLRIEENFELMNIHQLSRMARFFAKAQDLNLQTYPVLEKILEKLDKNLVNINEADVLTIMSAFE